MEQKETAKKNPFLISYLFKICDDFRREVESGADLEPLKEISYQNEQNSPDYSSKIAQQLYLLRYTYAYAFEYKQMFKTLLDRVPYQERIDVTSIGCGNGIDYWALQNALYESGKISCRITYHGIDYTDWSDYRMERLASRRWDVLDFVVQDALEYIRQQDTLTSDVFVFPKSISEFKEEFQEFCEVFAGKRFQKDTVHLLISLRKAYANADLKRSGQLAQAMERNGFRTRDDVGRYLQFEEGERVEISDADHIFCYPNKVREYVKNFREPIRYTDYTNYQVLTFEKNSKEQL